MQENKNIPFGVESKNYAIGRKTKRSWRYRLKRRTYEIIQAIHKYHQPKIDTILDIGTAEGAMLSSIKKEFPQAKCIGLEYSQELIDINQDKNIKIIQGDAQNLPFENNSFDIAIATAVIEHLPEPSKIISEAYRILKKNGLFILTTPDPFFDQIAEILSREETGHQITFNLRNLKENFKKVNFHILCAEKFMFSPIGFPAELKIEKLIKFFKLDFILLNQLIVGKK